MKKLFSIIGIGLAFIAGIGFMFLLIKGPIHTYHHHDAKTFVLSLFPPVAVYYGIESYTNHK